MSGYGNLCRDPGSFLVRHDQNSLSETSIGQFNNTDLLFVASRIGQNSAATFQKHSKAQAIFRSGDVAAREIEMPFSLNGQKAPADIHSGLKTDFSPSFQLTVL